MLYREPKLLKAYRTLCYDLDNEVSVLYREPKLLKGPTTGGRCTASAHVSVLYREPKLLKDPQPVIAVAQSGVSVLYREPKLLKV